MKCKIKGCKAESIINGMCNNHFHESMPTTALKTAKKNKKKESLVRQLSVIRIDYLVNENLLESDILDRFSDTGKVTFGDAYATLISPAQMKEICDDLSDDGESIFSADTFRKRYGKDTLIDLGS